MNVCTLVVLITQYKTKRAMKEHEAATIVLNSAFDD